MMFGILPLSSRYSLGSHQNLRKSILPKQKPLTKRPLSSVSFVVSKSHFLQFRSLASSSKPIKHESRYSLDDVDIPEKSSKTSNDRWREGKQHERMIEDRKLNEHKLPLTGPQSGSSRARKQTHVSPRYPSSFPEDILNYEEDSKQHLEAVKSHFSKNLNIEFEDWEQVQIALTHFSYIGARRHNDALSRLGEKALRFIIVSELCKEAPHLSKRSWFVPSNLRFLTRFDFLSGYIDSTLQISSLTRFTDPDDKVANKFKIKGKERQQLEQAVTSKSILAFIGIFYREKGEPVTRQLIQQLFIEPYKENGLFTAPVLQPTNISQTGGL